MHRITNTHDRAVGGPRGMLKPGQYIDLDLGFDELQIWEECPYVSVQDLVGPSGSEDAPGDTGERPQGHLQRDATAGPAPVGHGTRVSGKSKPRQPRVA